MATAPQQLTQVQPDPHLFLTGRPPLPEFLGFVAAKTIEGTTSDQGALAQAWREANTHISELEAKEAGYADAIGVKPVPPICLAAAKRVIAEPMVRRAFGLVPIEIAMVELDRLVVYQKHINLAHVADLHALLGENPSDEAIFRFALPADVRFDPAVQVMRTGQHEWTFVSPSTDFRPLEPMLLHPAQVAGLDSNGVPTHVLAVPFGYGSNFVNAIRVEGRLILNNGSHRAYTLRDAGLQYAPCLIQDVSARDELPIFGAGDVAERPEPSLAAPRPPLLKDYFDERLRMRFHAPRSSRQVRVGIGYGVSDVPAAG